jgi:arylsulfatase A-like enzyme
VTSRLRIVLLTCVLALACSREAGRLNIILIGVDTLRQDHLGCYGYERATSPNIDELAGRGVLCANAVSQCPWTLPSFASILTSLYPTQHGAGIDMNSMRTSFPTLAGMLAEEGYATGAVINVAVLSPAFGVDRGFAHYDAAAPGVRRIADEVTERALAWIESEKDGPFFLFVHYFDPHLSYSPPAPFDTLFDPGYEGEVGRAFEQETFLRLKDRLYTASDRQTRADWAHIEALYDGEIAFTDKAVGDLLAGIRSKGLEDRTLVVLVSDHGEEFMEHGGYGHGHTLFDEVIRVPLIFSLPGRLPEGVRVARQVRPVDIMPTILDLADVDGEYRPEGVSLVPLLRGEGPPLPSDGAMFPPHLAYSEGLHRGGERKGVTAYPWRYVYHLPTGDEVLFNLAEDPGETHNRVAEDLESLSLLKSVLFTNFLAMSETWYVKFGADGAAHEVDLRITAERGGGIGKIYFHRFLDGDGQVVEMDEAIHIERSGPRLTLNRLRLDTSLTLAFKVETPPGVRVSFDLGMDGEPAIARTFIGESLGTPDKMPFTPTRRRAAATGAAGPAAEPEPPYFLVWFQENRYGVRSEVTLNEDTKRELRALGYIQ